MAATLVDRFESGARRWRAAAADWVGPVHHLRGNLDAAAEAYATRAGCLPKRTRCVGQITSFPGSPLVILKWGEPVTVGGSDSNRLSL